MKKHFMSVYNYSTKNRAHAEFQKFINQFHYCLVDDTRLVEIIEEFQAEIQNIKEKYPRCDLIKLETWSHVEGSLAIAVSGNFQMDVHQVRRFEFSVPECKHPYTDYDGTSEYARCKSCGERVKVNGWKEAGK